MARLDGSSRCRRTRGRTELGVQHSHDIESIPYQSHAGRSGHHPPAGPHPASANSRSSASPRPTAAAGPALPPRARPRRQLPRAARRIAAAWRIRSGRARPVRRRGTPRLSGGSRSGAGLGRRASSSANYVPIVRRFGPLMIDVLLRARAPSLGETPGHSPARIAAPHRQAISLGFRLPSGVLQGIGP